MLKRSKLLSVALAAACLLAIGVSNAPANILSVNSVRWQKIWQPLSFQAGGNTIRCAVTLALSFHSATIRKVFEALIGYLTEVELRACTGGAVTILRETLPWHKVYDGFTGTLPLITGVRFKVIGMSFRVQPTGSIACLARSTTANPMREILIVGAGGAVRQARLDETASVPLEGFFCAFAGSGTFSGTGSIVRQGTTTQDVVLRLI